MLRALEIRDVLIIDRLDLNFQPGLNVLTGETGAGKSILLDSLGFVLGWRGRADLVREGADQGEVTAVFDLPADHPGQAVLEDAGLPQEDELILRRVNNRDGRKTAWVNDRRCSGETLRALSDHLVELHGQHDDRGLLDPKGHRDLLDIFAGSASKLEKTKTAWRNLARAKADLKKAWAALAEVQAEEEFLRHAVAELDKLDPQPGEEAVLDEQRRLMQAAERIREDITKANHAISYDGAEGMMINAQRWLDAVSDSAEGRLDAGIAALARAINELGEAQQAVTSCLSGLEFNPSDLDYTEERLFAIRALARKHGVAPDDLGGFAQGLRDKITALDGGAEDIQGLEDTVKSALEQFEQLAASLSAHRRKFAKSLDKAMAAELAPLKMERAVFETIITPTEAGPDGMDHVAFTVATNPGAPAGPLNKIASGGELSRFLLALKVCLTAEAKGLTMIFDEIDRGVGGATADAVGRRLADLADGAQVLVVTHSPQVAAKGQHHWQVAKEVTSGKTLSTVEPLSPLARIDEVARMLAGDRITDEARAAARALLDG